MIEIQLETGEMPCCPSRVSRAGRRGGERETENVAELATRENNSPAAATPLPAEARMESPATGAAPNRHHPPQSPGPARSPLLPVDYDISRRAGISLPPASWNCHRVLSLVRLASS